MEKPAELIEIADKLKRGEAVAPVSVRGLLGWFGASRRGYWIVKDVRQALTSLKVETLPDFESAFIDAPLAFQLKGKKVEIAPAVTNPEVLGDAAAIIEQETQPAANMVVGGSIDDPTYRIGKLEAANKPPTRIGPDSSMSEAVTLMLSHDFSQIPVMTSDREVKGVVSWLSIGSRLSFGHQPKTVRDCMDQHVEISADRSLFAAISLIAQSDYVLVRSTDQKISGIVTTADLSLQFRQLAEPFLLIGEIENHIRKMIDGKFSQPEILKACPPKGDNKGIARVSDLNFGEYTLLLSDPERWKRVAQGIDRKVFLADLELVRLIRNDVMHFDPDGLPEEDLQVLRRVARFLQQVSEVRVPSLS